MNHKSIIIKNGLVIDPFKGYNLEKMDLMIENGVFVDRIKESDPLEINAERKIILPGGVDIHSHFAGSKVNLGRLLRPEEHRLRHQFDNSGNHIGSGWATPTPPLCGYLYSRLGYTQIVEPAVPPLKARHTHEEMRSVPYVDKMSLLLLGNNWVVMDLIAESRLDLLKEYVLWVLWASKTYGIKIVAPGSGEAWAWGKSIIDIDEEIPNFSITPRDIIYNLAKINRKIGLKTPVHIHTNNLGTPGNYQTTIDSLRAVKNIGLNCETAPFAIHLVHAQFSSYKGDSWKAFSSGAEEIAAYINNHNHVSFDIGQIIFGNTTTMTADGAWQYTLHKLTGSKWVNNDVENETAAGVVPYTFKRKNYVNAIQWAVGLELALLVKDPWKIVVTTDHPNGGSFTSYPVIIAWLTSKKFREKTIEKLNTKARSAIILPSIDREYTLFESVIVTRSAPARIIGVKDKATISIGGEANLAIYDLGDPEQNLTENPVKLIKGLSTALYTIKNGRIVMKEGAPVECFNGVTYYTGAVAESKELSELTDYYFKEYYTIEKENYIVQESEVMNPVNVLEEV
ncbi:MAG: formylmethanofuran dehydrogenase subunit A [Candidatus Odinarchaeum yellowstonii]|uniref:Formylmethanofuran dehydrogenase subunit A n=1 Tax=Odinarchaeota yellowstonii (strain LCB_4) TaxID=1841599 RepID=A0AAF0IBU4_ODILC|nr:MAG: formylmethanofuran dehydrogenase subunit A [Candidatus Odinarchaeum yellowstonii]